VTQMFGNSPIRRLRRHLSTALVWAMLPMAVLGGMPTANCACVNCQCGAACGLPGHTACCPAVESAAQNVCRCKCCNGHCDGKCCCCVNTQPQQKQPLNPADSKQKLCSLPASRCHVSISSAASAIVAAMVGIDHHQPLTLDLPATLDSPLAVAAVDHFDGFSTGPPVDFVVTLQRLVI